jgi:hypothetical protein
VTGAGKKKVPGTSQVPGTWKIYSHVYQEVDKMREQTIITSRKSGGFYGAIFALLSFILSLTTFLLAPAWPVVAQGPTPTLPPAAWETPMGGAPQTLPGETDWMLIGLIVAAIAVVLLVMVLLLVLFMRAGRKKAPPAYPPPPPEAFRRPAATPGDYQETVAGARVMASLTIQEGPGAGQHFALNKPETILGRHSANDVVIQHNEVSRRHASITRQGNRFILRDLGSNNGTFVNGRRLSAPHDLRNGDVIMLGEVASLVFQG